MEPLRILHIADVHLDTPFYGREESLRRKLREACSQAFRAAVDTAIERDVHAFLIAGDLFDNDLLTFATERFILEEMHRLKEAGISVFYTTGNHDPGRANYRAQHLEWPDNVHLFISTVPETCPITNYDGKQLGWLTAAGHSTAREETNLAKRYEKARPDFPHIGLLHTQVVSAFGAEKHDPYAPCSWQDLVEPGYDYWALGHIHLREPACEDAPAWYSGNLQGRNPKETGPKGALYVELEQNSVAQPDFVPLSPMVWDSLEIVCPALANTVDSLAKELARELSMKADLTDRREHLIRVSLTGESRLAAELRDPENLDDLGDTVRDLTGVTWLEVRLRSLVRPLDIGSYLDSPTVLGEALELLSRLREDDELLEHIRPDTLASGGSGDVRRYLRGLLEGMDREAASLLVPEEER
jgi:DNA repair exonuclease SbcCD nuclease subunit